MEKDHKKFDICLMNPPYDNGIDKGSKKDLHIIFVDKCIDFCNKTIVVMPIKFIKNDANKLKNYKQRFDKYLVDITEIDSSVFEGTKMPNIAIYNFNNDKQNDYITITLNNNKIIKTKTIIDINFNDIDKELFEYLQADVEHMNWIYFGSDKNNLEESYKHNIEKMYRQKRFNNLINSDNPAFLLCAAANGGMNARYFTNSTNQICKDKEDLLKTLVNRGGGVATVLYFKSVKCAENCKVAMQNPVLRYACYKNQVDQNMKSRVYKYIPNIDWSDDHVKTDEGLLEVCGCPKDKIKEYADYCKDIINKVDNGERP